MFPVFFLSALLSLVVAGSAVAVPREAGLPQLVAEASSLTDDRSNVVVALTLSQALPWELELHAHPARLAIRFRALGFGTADPAQLDRSANVTALDLRRVSNGISGIEVGLGGPMMVTEAAMTVGSGDGLARLRVVLSPIDAARFAALAVPSAPPPPRPLIVMLDPGHGGGERGAVRDGIEEADLMLAFARQLRAELRRSTDFDIRLTRAADRHVPLAARVRMARDAGADVFMSLHADALARGRASGAAIYTLGPEARNPARGDARAGRDPAGLSGTATGTPADFARRLSRPRSAALARALLAEIRAAELALHKHPDKSADFAVLRAPDIPSVLVELGFLSDPGDRARLADPDWRARLAAALRDGLLVWDASRDAPVPADGDSVDPAAPVPARTGTDVAPAPGRQKSVAFDTR